MKAKELAKEISKIPAPSKDNLVPEVSKIVARTINALITDHFKDRMKQLETLKKRAFISNNDSNNLLKEVRQRIISFCDSLNSPWLAKDRFKEILLAEVERFEKSL